jgi:hypothetical protein
MKKEIKTRKAYRQGELVFVPLSNEDMAQLNPSLNDLSHSQWSKLKTNVLREGEATGHKHEVVESTPGTAILLAPERQFLPGLPGMDILGIEDRFLAAQEPVEIVHPEHRPMPLPKGFYLVIVQREYDEVKSRRILD